MKTNIATDSSQSQRLLSCGVSADTADMTGVEPDYGYECEPWSSMQGQDTRGYFPAWSLSALLTKVLPSDVDLRMLKLGTGAFNNPNAWSIMYSADLYTEHSDIFEACVLMAEKLVANGYKLNDPDCLCREKGGEK